MKDFPERAERGLAYPLGATFDGRGVNFAVFSGSADQVVLCLFDAGGRHEVERYVLPECTDGVWHGYVPNVRPGTPYGYRVYGAYEPEQGIRHNPNKLLLDPYARQLVGSHKWSDALHGYRINSPRGDLSFDRRDSAFAVMKGVVVDDHFDWGHDRPPRTPWSDTIIYEAHVRGLTKGIEGIPEKERGTFGALGHDKTLDYLRGLGITAIELLPIHAFMQDRFLVEKKLSNYWGYSTLSFFAPEPRYLSDGSLGQLKWAIKRLHAVGIEVILDVVYNHTCEGSELGPTLSWRGFDHAAYYRLLPDKPRYLINDTGTGNTLNLSHPRVIQMVMDSLRYWVNEFHVDGFRFDLGVTLGREPHGFDRGAGFFDALMQDPTLARVKLISEPWDVGPGGYQIGNHPAGMAEWNGRYRDDVRRFWRGDAGMRGALAGALQGSADLFDHERRRPWASVNFITAHDGFTLRDWVSYEQKHNEANGEGGNDGANDNESNNWGAEGETDDAGIVETRRRVARAAAATLLFSHGTPMLLSGDEAWRTQGGNNNPYCQDNEISWTDWRLTDSPEGREMRKFVAHCIRLRRELASLRSEVFQHGQQNPLPDVRDIDWFDETGKTLEQSDWQYHEARLLAARRCVRLDRERVEVSLLLVNNSAENREFRLPGPELSWRLRLDSSQVDRDERALEHDVIEVGWRSVMLLTAFVEATETITEPAEPARCDTEPPPSMAFE